MVDVSRPDTAHTQRQMRCYREGNRTCVLHHTNMQIGERCGERALVGDSMVAGSFAAGTAGIDRMSSTMRATRAPVAGGLDIRRDRLRTRDDHHSWQTNVAVQDTDVRTSLVVG